MAEISWTDAERDAVVEGGGGFLEDWQADLILDALAPHVAAREAQAAAKALREAAEWADNDDVDEDGERVHLYNGDVGDWLREHADRIERGESS